MDVRKNLKSENLAAFKRSFCNFFDVLNKFTPDSELVFDDDGEPDVIVNGKLFYKDIVGEYASTQLERFRNDPIRYYMNAPEYKNVDEQTGRFLSKALGRANDEGIEFFKLPRSNESYFLLIFGIGLGKHIDELVKISNCYSLLIIDLNMNYLYHSLEYYDWKKLIGEINNKKGFLQFIIDNDPQRIWNNIRHVISSTSPCSVDGMANFFLYESEIFYKSSSFFYSDANMIISGLGFFDDEILMLKYTHQNLLHGKSKVYYKKVGQKIDVPVFVIGSGPSLDNDIPFIRENIDKAIIISNGSALRPLVNNGVKPDFHIEIENLNVSPLIYQVAEENDISSTCLVASSTVEPILSRCFNNVIFYFRPSLSSYPLFCGSKKYSLGDGPTVLNIGLSFAQELGFTNIYFFGTDLGVKNPEHHHSRDSHQYTEGAILDSHVYDIPIQANFGGTCLTCNEFYVTRDYIKIAIENHQGGRNYFNCSDGVHIPGALPQLTGSLSLPSVENGGKKIVQDIIEDFPIYTMEKFKNSWKNEITVAEINEVVNSFLNYSREISSFQDKSYLKDIMDMFPPTIQDDEASSNPAKYSAIIMFRGTVYMMLISLEFYLNRVSNPDLAARMDNIFRQEFISAIENLQETANKELCSLTISSDKCEDTSLGGTTAGRDAALCEATWVSISRNASCPCGSGKKFKQCHGKILV